MSKTINDILHTTPLPVTNTGTGTTAQAVQGNTAGATTDVGNPIKVGAVYNATPPTYANGERTDLQAGTRGSLNVSIKGNDITGFADILTSGQDGLSNLVLNGLRTVSYNVIFNGSVWDRLTKANNVSRIVSSAATTNATSAKASSGNVYSITAFNTVAAAKFLKLYNKASAPVVGTDTPFATIAIPGSSQIDIVFPTALFFNLGIAYALTGAVADADTTALAAGDIVALNVFYS